MPGDTDTSVSPTVPGGHFPPPLPPCWWERQDHFLRRRVRPGKILLSKRHKQGPAPSPDGRKTGKPAYAAIIGRFHCDALARKRSSSLRAREAWVPRKIADRAVHQKGYRSILMIRSANWKSYHRLSLSFFERIRLPDMPKDIPKHIPTPIPAIPFNAFMKTILQSIAIAIPMMIPVTILLLFICFFLQLPICRSVLFHVSIKRDRTQEQPQQ